MTIRCFCAAVLFLVLTLPAQAAKSPNIVFLLADDLGWTGLNCFGSDFYETPNLDRLAKQGMKFTNAYSACTVCSPTRASIMTGMYPARLRLTDFIAGQNRPYAKLNIPAWTKGLHSKYTTVAEALQANNYETIQVGKWHLSPAGNAVPGGNPDAHGFDRQILKPRQAKGYYLPEGFNKQGESKSDYLTDYLTDQALQTIDELKTKPFFLYFAYHTPHTPIQGRQDYVEYFQSKVRQNFIHHNPVYAAMVKSLDDSVGRILDRLDKHGLRENTIVIFTSDNGGLTQRYGVHDDFTENLPLRRGKGSAYEGGVRVPTIVRAPGLTTAGSECAQPVMTIDWYPTILELTGTEGNADHNSLMDGVSLVPLLKEPTTSLDRNLYWHYPHYHAGGDGPYSAIRAGNWRLIEFHEDEHQELYHLKTDLGEQKNLVNEHPEKAAALFQQLQQWRTSIKAQMPVPNPNHDPQRETVVGKKRR